MSHRLKSSCLVAALLIGSDLPLLTGRLLRQAAALLTENQAVLGPADDGGYYLIGFTRAGYLPDVFRNMPWSTPAVAAVTLARLADAGRATALLPPLPDCDVAADLTRLAGAPLRERLAGTPFGRFLASGSFRAVPGRLTNSPAAGKTFGKI